MRSRTSSPAPCLLPAYWARGPVPLPDRVLPDPGRTRLHRHRHAAGPAWLRLPLAERMARSLPRTARSPRSKLRPSWLGGVWPPVGLQPARRRSLEFEGVAVRVGDVDRRAVALGAVALADLAGVDAEAAQAGFDLVGVVGLHPYREMVHVAGAGRCRRGRWNQVDQRGAGAQLHELGLFQRTLDMAAQHLGIEIDRP